MVGGLSMKKSFIIYILIIAAGLNSSAQSIAERVVLSCDRNNYVSGERIWCSAFCLDVAGEGKLSTISSVAYVELVSTQGQASCSKIALVDGRGCGTINIPFDTPSGNYMLCAYTNLQKNQDPDGITAWGKPVTIYNTLTSERINGEYKITSGDWMAVKDEHTDNDPRIDISIQSKVEGASRVPVMIKLNGISKASFSVSIWHEDSLGQMEYRNITDILGKTPKGNLERASAIAEYDGEIIHARIKSPSLHQIKGTSAFISSPGHADSIYSAPIDDEGNVTFFTGNIFGKSDIVFQIEEGGLDEDYSVSIDSPFIGPKLAAGLLPEFIIDPLMEQSLRERSIHMQINNQFSGEDLYRAIPGRDNLLLLNGKSISYLLDDYVRYPSMNEVIVEILKQVKIIKNDGKDAIAIRLSDDIPYNHDNLSYSSGALILLDGVPVLDHAAFLEYDPLLVERVDIYPYPVVTGSRIFEGVADFKTKKGNLAGAVFDKRTKILAFQGIDLPKRFTPDDISSNFPDYRQTLYWHPLVELEENETLEFDCITPAYSGKFKIRIEGIDVEGHAFCSEREFTVG